jgi:hypothetical protein
MQAVARRARNQNPASFFLQIERIKSAAEKAQDEDALRKLTDEFLAVTKKLAVQDWKGYESCSDSGHPPELTATIHPRHNAAPHPHPAARHRHKQLKSKSASA